MKEIYELGIKIAGYLGGAAIGALVSWYFTKQHYEKIVDEEVKSIRAVKERKANKSVLKYDDYGEAIKPYVTTYNSGPKDDTLEKPYLISMETFDDADPTFEKVLLEYYTEDKVLVDNDEVILAEDSIGVENLNRFDKRMDLIVMYVRNERLGVDYEVSKVIARWSE